MLGRIAAQAIRATVSATLPIVARRPRLAFAAHAAYYCASTRREEHMDIGRIGIWTSALDFQPAAKAQEAAAEIEALGYGALWFPEAVGREALTNAGVLLAGTKRITIATGIANIWGRDAL